MLNGITSPTEVMNAAIMDSKPKQQYPTTTTTTISSPSTTTPYSAMSSVAVESKPASFCFSGTHLHVPYNIVVNIESTSDPAGAERHAKKVIFDEIFNLATTIFHQQQDHINKNNANQEEGGEKNKLSEISNINASISSSSPSVFNLSEPLENLLLQNREVCRGTDNVFRPFTFVGSETENNSKTFDDCFELKMNEDETNSSSSSSSSSFYQLVKKIPSAKLDLYGISKGWILDSMCSSLISSGFSGVMADWGGDIKCQGKTLTNEAWKIGLEKAHQHRSGDGNSYNKKETVTYITLCDAACATSGNYKQQKDHIRIAPIQQQQQQQQQQNESAARRQRSSESMSDENEKSSHQQKESSKIASVTVVHPSASTADALATYFFCYLRSFEMMQQEIVSESMLQTELFRLCNEKVSSSSSSSTSTTWFGNEIQQVILQWWKDDTNNFCTWFNSNNTSACSSSSSTSTSLSPLNATKEISLIQQQQPQPPQTGDKFDKDVTDQLRRSMQRMVAVLFIKIDSTFFLGCTLSSGSLLSSQFFNCQPKLKNQLVQHHDSTNDDESQIKSNNNDNIHTFLFSAMKNSRLYNLMLRKNKKQEIWLMLPRVGFNTMSASLSSSSSSSSLPVSASQKQLSILSNFAGGKMITWNELQAISSSSSSSCPIFKCPTDVFMMMNQQQQQFSSKININTLDLICGDHGIFTLPVQLSPQQSLALISPTTSTPILHVGRNYATLSTSSASSSTLTPRLSASSKKPVFEQLMNPISPTTCGIFTRIAKNGQFFGVTCSNIEFISTSTDHSYSPVLQLACPVNELSLAALADVLPNSTAQQQQQQQQQQENSSSSTTTSSMSSSTSPNLNHKLKLHVFGEHADAHSVLKWFADPSFMDSKGLRTEHFMYLPSASDAEDAERYLFPGTAGKGGCLYSMNATIVHVDKVSAGVLLVFVQVTGCKKHFTAASPGSVNEKSLVPTFWWM